MHINSKYRWLFQKSSSIILDLVDTNIWLIHVSLWLQQMVINCKHRALSKCDNWYYTRIIICQLCIKWITPILFRHKHLEPIHIQEWYAAQIISPSMVQSDSHWFQTNHSCMGSFFYVNLAFNGCALTCKIIYYHHLTMHFEVKKVIIIGNNFHIIVLNIWTLSINMIQSRINGVDAISKCQKQWLLMAVYQNWEIFGFILWKIRYLKNQKYNVQEQELLISNKWSETRWIVCFWIYPVSME